MISKKHTHTHTKQQTTEKAKKRQKLVYILDICMIIIRIISYYCSGLLVGCFLQMRENNNIPTSADLFIYFVFQRVSHYSYYFIIILLYLLLLLIIILIIIILLSRHISYICT